MKRIVQLFFLITLLGASSGFAQVKSDSVTKLLCGKSWHMVKLTDISGKGQSMGGEIFNVTTTFLPDGTLETMTSGNLATDKWKLLADGVTLQTSQLQDPKTGQEKISIVEISDKVLKIQVTYRGNNIMQYDYN
jgi:hypothetical protein